MAYRAIYQILTLFLFHNIINYIRYFHCQYGLDCKTYLNYVKNDKTAYYDIFTSCFVI